jgi:hypothetical protein
VERKKISSPYISSEKIPAIPYKSPCIRNCLYLIGLFISGLQCPRNVVLQIAELISVPIFLVRKVLANLSQQKVKHDFAVGTNLQFLPRISSRVYSVISKNSSEAKICQT